MRTKLFLAFLVVIFIALISNLIFERLIMNDFDEYMKGSREDQLYWVLASVEGSFQDGKWNMGLLSESLHWAMMLGFDVKVLDSVGREFLDSRRVMESLPPAMKKRMLSIVHLHPSQGEYETYPLYSEGRELGILLVRPIGIYGATHVKEQIFKQRGNLFLIISFVIAGAGAMVMAVFLSLSISRPLKRLKEAAERVAAGDFSVRIPDVRRSGKRGERIMGDEIGMLSESFNYMAEALEKEEELRRRLTTNVAHELRTPLAVMRAHVEAMIDGVIENKSEGLENVRNEIAKLTRLVQGIEDITKAEASFFARGELRKVNIREFVSGIQSAVYPFVHEKGLELTVADHGDLEVLCDTGKLEMIMNNIITNALKYTETGGINIDYGRAGKEFFVEVRDTGRGIPEEDIPNIFKRFYRGSGLADEGIGVGLAIVKELVTIMGGRIDVTSKVGEGTTFRFRLPFKQQVVAGRKSAAK